MNKKAQGALEFLMTYGWAFLVILIMIGALAYFGVLSPSKFLPERCTLTTGLTCEDYKLTTTTVDLKVRNNMGMTITVSDFSMTDANGQFMCGFYTGDDGTNPAVDYPDNSINVSDGATFDLSGTDCSGGGIAVGSKFKSLPTVTYFDPRSGASYDHTIEGEVYALAQTPP